jgi:hypothetical protein
MSDLRTRLEPMRKAVDAYDQVLRASALGMTTINGSRQAGLGGFVIDTALAGHEELADELSRLRQYGAQPFTPPFAQ